MCDSVLVSSANVSSGSERFDISRYDSDRKQVDRMVDHLARKRVRSYCRYLRREGVDISNMPHEGLIISSSMADIIFQKVLLNYEFYLKAEKDSLEDMRCNMSESVAVLKNAPQVALPYTEIEVPDQRCTFDQFVDESFHQAFCCVVTFANKKLERARKKMDDKYRESNVWTPSRLEQRISKVNLCTNRCIMAREAMQNKAVERYIRNEVVREITNGGVVCDRDVSNSVKVSVKRQFAGEYKKSRRGKLYCVYEFIMKLMCGPPIRKSIYEWEEYFEECLSSKVSNRIGLKVQKIR